MKHKLDEKPALLLILNNLRCFLFFLGFFQGAKKGGKKRKKSLFV